MDNHWDREIMPTSSQLVRSFSDDLEKQAVGDALTRGLVAKVSLDRQRERNAALQEEWNHFLIEGRELAHSDMPSLVPDEEALLREQSRKLYKAWNDFCKRLPREQREKACDEIPSIKLLHASVSQAAESWKDKREGTKIGRTKRIFTRLCETFLSHKNLVSVLPTDNMYVTLITGSLTAIAQASINHQELAEGVSSTLEDLSDDMNYWNELIREYSDTQILHRMVKVVVEKPLMRFITSFDEKAFKRVFSERRDRIKAIEQRLKKNAELEFERNTTSRLKTNASLQDQLRSQQTQMAMNIQEMRHDMTRQNELIYQLGASVFRLLAEKSYPHSPGTPGQPRLEEGKLESLVDLGLLTTIQSSGWAADGSVQSIPSAIPANTSTIPKTPTEDMPLRPHSQRFNRQEILDLLGPITAKYARDIQHVVGAVTQASRAQITETVRRRIEVWTVSAQSDKLWVQGPYERTHPSNTTFTAVCLVALANNSNIPCLSYFCSLGVHGTAASLQLTCQDMLADMVKSLIVQLLLLLPDEMESTPSLSRYRFAKLLDPHIDIEESMLLFRDLRALAPPYIHCVIDAAQELEDRSDLRYTQSLYRVLRTILDIPDRSGRQTPARENVVKGCITSDGYVDVLAVLVERAHVEKMEVDESEELLAEDGPGLVSQWNEHDGDS
ncbi:hypothetical protein EKO27_g2021 [Xylaria grammica]|uniref:Uncharacterized protein n=1 Tax=Xylaria grammica TaxID=363999 RepID=A0A439DFC0_9PEZI|nr:hypothetical protein EKO27_g2021 [Xylaria grammica]